MKAPVSIFMLLVLTCLSTADEIQMMVNWYSASGLSGDGSLGFFATLTNPVSVCIDKTRMMMYITDSQQIRVMNFTDGIINKFAGTYSVQGDSGTGGAATSATLNNPSSVAIDEIRGQVYIAGMSHTLYILTITSYWSK